jgi:hypothetical protein
MPKEINSLVVTKVLEGIAQTFSDAVFQNVRAVVRQAGYEMHECSLQETDEGLNIMYGERCILTVDTSTLPVEQLPDGGVRLVVTLIPPRKKALHAPGFDAAH